MNMTIGDALNKFVVLTNVPLSSKDGSLKPDLKVKLMDMRIELKKIKKDFDADIQEFVEGIKTDEFNELANKQERTEEEMARITEIAKELDGQIFIYENKKKSETCEFNETLTNDEWKDIVRIMTNDIEINGQKIAAAEFLEILRELFVAEA